MATIIVNIAEANLPRLIAMVEADNEVMIARGEAGTGRLGRNSELR